jgi:S1-C subfamily serine protease
MPYGPIVAAEPEDSHEAVSVNSTPAAIASSKPAATAPIPESTRAYFGIVPDRSARASNVGVLVQGVQPGSPAAAADVRAGDLIIEFANQTITNLDQLGHILDASRAGQSVTLVALRGAARIRLSVQLANPPSAVH